MSIEINDYIKQDCIEQDYVQKGFLKLEEVGDLHMAFSPYRIPKGLTKLQIRRRINAHLRNPQKQIQKSLKVLFSNSLEVLINGKCVLHADFTGKIPNDHRSLHKLLKAL